LWGLVGAMAVAGIGIGPTIVTIYSLAADRAPQGRSATLMSMLGSATIVGQSATSALTGAVADGVGAEAAMWLPTGAAAFVVLAALVNASLGDPRAATPSEPTVEERASTLEELPAEHLGAGARGSPHRQAGPGHRSGRRRATPAAEVQHDRGDREPQRPRAQIQQPGGPGLERAEHVLLDRDAGTVEQTVAEHEIGRAHV